MRRAGGMLIVSAAAPFHAGGRCGMENGLPIAAMRQVGAGEPATWPFRPMPGTPVPVDSAPEAAAPLDDQLPMRAEPLSRPPVGFQRFRLHV